MKAICKTIQPTKYLIVLCVALSTSVCNRAHATESTPFDPSAQQAFDDHYSQAYQLYATDPDQAIMHARQAAQIALENNQYPLIGKAHYMAGYIFKIKGDLPNAFNYFLGAEKAYLKALEHPATRINKGQTLRKRLCQVREHLGTIAMDNSSHTTAILMYQNRLTTARKIDRRTTAQAYFDLGLAHFFNNSIDSAYYYHLQAISLYEHGGFYTPDDANDVARIFIEIGAIHYYLAKGQQHDPRYDSALNYYREAIRLTESQTTHALAYNNIASVHLARKEHHQAEDFTRLAIAINQPAGRSRMLIDNYNNLGRIFYETHQFDSAIHYFTLAVDVNVGFDDLTQNHTDTQLAIDMNQNYEMSISFHYLDSLSHYRPDAINATSASRIVSRYYEMALSGRLLSQVESQSIIDILYTEKRAEDRREARRQTIWRWTSVTLVTLLSLVIAYLSYHLIRYRSLKKALTSNLRRILYRSPQ